MNKSFVCGTKHLVSLRSSHSTFERSLTLARPWSQTDDTTNARTFHLLRRNQQKHSFSTFPCLFRPNQTRGIKEEEPEQGLKKKTTRLKAAKSSLRRVAVEAQRSRDGKDLEQVPKGWQQDTTKIVTAICAAEQYDIGQVAAILAGSGHEIDPYKTGLFPQVVHVILPIENSPLGGKRASRSVGDLFIFPSGTVVSWAVPEDRLASLINTILAPAAQNPLKRTEEEDLEFVEDPRRENSTIKGDTIVLGTRTQDLERHAEVASHNETGRDGTSNEATKAQGRDLDMALAKIAFSSGLARSTKLAVLESLLNDYFESTKTIPAVLSKGGRMPFTRSFISQKTGQLLGIRAQLNLYSELIDSLPDLFWDSRHELGLEGYFDQVGRALDTNIRIKVLNEKMDYAQEIASVLRQQLSEKHGARLEWIIILLIAVEVIFAIPREIKEYNQRSSASQEFV